MKFNIELRLDGGDYAFLKSYDLFRVGLAGVIDDDQGLLFPYGSASAPTAFPSTLLNHPGCRHLDRTDCHVATLLAMTWGTTLLAMTWGTTTILAMT